MPNSLEEKTDKKKYRSSNYWYGHYCLVRREQIEMHILDHKRVNWSALKVAIVTSTGVDITGGRYTRCYDQFKRYFIQAGRSLVFNLPARIYFAKATRGRNVEKRVSHPGDAISRGGSVCLDPHSPSLSLPPPSSHESWWKNNNPGGTVSYGEWNHLARPKFVLLVFDL